MSVGVNIALGLGSAVVWRWLSNTALQATMPDVDPSMPTAGPVLGAVAIPGIGAGLAYAYKYPKVASVLAGVAAGSGISTAEYMAYAKGAQSGPALPAAKSYQWIAVHKDGSLETVDSGTFDLAKVAQEDAIVVNKYGGDPDITMIVRKDDAGNAVPLATKSPQLPQGIAVGEPVMKPQSGVVVRTMMRR